METIKKKRKGEIQRERYQKLVDMDLLRSIKYTTFRVMMSSSSFEEIVEILSIEKKSNCKKKGNFKYPNIVEAAHYAKAFTLWKASEKYKIPLSSIGRHMSRLFPKK